MDRAESCTLGALEAEQPGGQASGKRTVQPPGDEVSWAREGVSGGYWIPLSQKAPTQDPSETGKQNSGDLRIPCRLVPVQERESA